MTDWLGISGALLYIFLWASAYAPSKIGATDAPPLWFLVVRFGVAGIALLALAVITRRRFPAPRTIAIAVAVGILANAAYLGFTYTALRHLASGVGAIIASTNPLMLALVAPWLLGERLSPLRIAGLVAGFGGVVAIMWSRTGTGTAAPGDVLLATLGVAASVASNVLYKRGRGDADLLVFAALGILGASVALIPVAALTEGTPHVVAGGTALAAAFVYLVLALSIGATLLWFWLLSRGEASRVSAYYFLTPVFGLVLGALVLHEPLRGGDLPGLVAVALGIALVQRG